MIRIRFGNRTNWIPRKKNSCRVYWSKLAGQLYCSILVVVYAQASARPPCELAKNKAALWYGSMDFTSFLHYPTRHTCVENGTAAGTVSTFFLSSIPVACSFGCVECYSWRLWIIWFAMSRFIILRAQFCLSILFVVCEMFAKWYDFSWTTQQFLVQKKM